MTTSCDLIIAELLEIKAEIAALEDKFVSKDNKQELAQSLFPFLSPLFGFMITQETAKLLGNSKEIAKLTKDVATQGSKLAKIGAGIARFATLGSLLASVGLTVAALESAGSRVDAAEFGIERLSADVSRLMGAHGVTRQRADRALEKIESSINTFNSKIDDINSWRKSLENSINEKINNGYRNIVRTYNPLIAKNIRAIIELNTTTKSLAMKLKLLEQDIQTSWNNFIREYNHQAKVIAEFVFGVLASSGTLISELSEKSEEYLDIIKSNDFSKSELTQAIKRLTSNVETISKNLLNKSQVDEMIVNQINKYKIPELITKIPTINASIQALSIVVNGLKDGIKKIDNTIPTIRKNINDTTTNVVKRIAPEIVNKSVPKIINSAIPKILPSLMPSLAPLIVPSLLPQIAPELTPQLIPQLIPKLTPELTSQINQQINTYITNYMTTVDLTPVLRKQEETNDLIKNALPAAIITTLINSNKATSWGVGVAKQGTCQALQPNQCGDQAIKRNFDDKLGAVNLLGQGIDLTILGIINEKLGDQITDAGGKKIGIGGHLQRFAKSTAVDRLLNLVGTAASVHNAMMLSNNLGQTLISTIDMIVNNFGIKDGENTNFSFSALVGKTVKQFLEGLIGANNYTKLSEGFAKANRIYQTGSNLFSTIRSMHDTTLTLTTTISNNTGKIGNRLREQGVINFDSLPPMAENLQPNKFSGLIQKLEKANDAASAISSITSDVVSIKDDIKSIKEDRDSLEKEFKESVPKSEDKEIKNIKVKERDDKLERDTKPPEISSKDVPSND
jgi:predicted  nucleic acid-binding Zn-ribbon protein